MRGEGIGNRGCVRGSCRAAEVGRRRCGGGGSGRSDPLELKPPSGGMRERNRSSKRKASGKLEHGESRAKVEDPSGLLSMEGIPGWGSRVSLTGRCGESSLDRAGTKGPTGSGGKGRRRGVRGSAGGWWRQGITSPRPRPLVRRSGLPNRENGWSIGELSVLWERECNR